MAQVGVTGYLTFMPNLPILFLKILCNFFSNLLSPLFFFSHLRFFHFLMDDCLEMGGPVEKRWHTTPQWRRDDADSSPADAGFYFKDADFLSKEGKMPVPRFFYESVWKKNKKKMKRRKKRKKSSKKDEKRGVRKNESWWQKSFPKNFDLRM